MLNPYRTAFLEALALLEELVLAAEVTDDTMPSIVVGDFVADTRDIITEIDAEEGEE